MKVSAAMTRDVKLVKPETTIREAAALMAQIDAGSLPVAEDDRLIGMVTDRDIAIRAVAEGKLPQTKVSEVMTREMLYCFDDQELDDIAKNMGQNQVRRLPVVNHDKRLVGILSLGDLARKDKSAAVGKAVSRVSEPSQKHSQTAQSSA
ncbi:MAG TPA: CBS domain-containing protein [Casimicrobiaceae bacterium]|nr:CBS domain-containing protein [Casimicrobiaceae bacterium]